MTDATHTAVITPAALPTQPTTSAPLSGRERAVAGIDIGGTKIAALLVDQAGLVLASGTVAAPARAGGAAMSAAAAGLVQDLQRSSGRAISAAGVGAAGVIDPETGTVTAASASFTDWVGFPLATDLGSLLGVEVAVDNDVNAFLHGELKYGALAGSNDAVGIMLGTGVGGAVAVDGRIFTGLRGAAGEIGHTPGYSEIICTCGQRGHLETLASGRSIGLRYGERSGGAATLSAVDVAERARGGDQHAIATFEAAGHAIAIAIATAVNLLDVQDVVVGGGVRGAWDLLEPAIARTLHENQPVSGYPLVVVPSALGGHSVALGAAALAWRLLDRATQPHTTSNVKNTQNDSVRNTL